MKFTLISLLSLVALAVASPISIPQRLDDITVRSPLGAEEAAMSDASGNVVAFDSTKVHKTSSS
ncbi:hypothetical protein F5884DRAFT_848791 [Xylogone sp. PMI_703]|nr:hypothetical protein F5884DRAFT_848791 [Xylogone sp. PMI_703]